MRENKRKLGLVPKLIIAIVLGILIGSFCQKASAVWLSHYPDFSVHF